MAFFTVNTEAAAKQEGGNYINQSGVYDVTLKAVIVDYNDHGARTLNFYVENNGQDQVIYGGLRLDNNDGTPNFQAPLFNKLCVVAGLDGAIADPEEVTLPIGKEGADKDVAVLPDFQDIDLKMWVQLEYSVIGSGAKQGQISEKKVIKGFYNAEGASSDEIINGTEVGVRFAKDSKYHNNTSYKDGLTEEAVNAWIAGGRQGTPAGVAPKAAAPKASFGKPKFGAK